MGLLDGDLQDVFGSVFGPRLLPATITKPVLTSDGAGGFTEGTPETSDARGMVDTYTARERAVAKIPSTDVKLVLMQKDVTVTPDTDSMITIRGVTYSVQDVEQDAALASWTIQGRAIDNAD